MSDHAMPARLERPRILTFVLLIGAAAFVLSSFTTTGVSLEKLIRGLPALGRLGSQMFPPSTERLEAVFWSLLQTFQMAVAGTILGLALSLPLAILAAPSLSPHPFCVWMVRGLVALFRTVPDLVWAIVFVIAVGLGPAAGVLALMVDTTGFAARFFAEAMEETDKGPREALSALGASRSGIIFSSVIPQALPSMINTSLFSREGHPRIGCAWPRRGRRHRDRTEGLAGAIRIRSGRDDHHCHLSARSRCRARIHLGSQQGPVVAARQSERG